MDKEGKVALMLGKGVAGICNGVMEEVGECIGCIREGSNCCVGRLLLDFGPPLSCQLSSTLNIWTWYVAFN